MSNVIPYPGTVKALGFTFPAAVLRAGIEVATSHGFERAEVKALMTGDRPFAVYFLAHLGSADEHDQRVGAFGLRRLIGNMESAA